MQRVLPLLLLALLAPLGGAGQALPDDPTPLLGSGLADFLAQAGPPSSVLAARGPEVWQDDVVFVYPPGLRCHWYIDRLWRLSFGTGYPATVFGLFVGDPQDKALSLLGPPWLSGEGLFVWRLPWKGYPVALSAEIKDGKIAGLAVYRSDM
jgi:hypothetical protein